MYEERTKRKYSILLFLFSAIMMASADDAPSFLDCTKEQRVVDLCLQDNLVSCGQECALRDTTISVKNETTCMNSKTTFCGIAECCPACFGETQALLDCQFTLEDEDAPICDTECSCTDVPDWHDEGGDSYDCAWYAADAETRCSKFGDSNAYKGYTANSACCVCKKIIDSSAPGFSAALGGVISGAFVVYMMM